jgi:hypothetical protein
MSKADDIIDGFSNLAKDKLGLLKKEEITRNEKRMGICNKCPHKTSSGRCSKCGCVLAAKTKCDKCKCPIGLW